MAASSSQLPSLHIVLPRLNQEKAYIGTADIYYVSVIAELGKRTYLLQEMKSLGKKSNITHFDTVTLVPIAGQFAVIAGLVRRALYTTCKIKGSGEWLLRRSKTNALAKMLDLKSTKTLDLTSMSVRKAAAEYIKTEKPPIYDPGVYRTMVLTTLWGIVCKSIRKGKRFVNDGQNRLVINLKHKHVEFSCPTSPAVVYPVVQAYFKSIKDEQQFAEVKKLTHCMQAHNAYTESGIHQVYIRESTVSNGKIFNPTDKIVNVSVSDGKLCNPTVVL